MTTGKCICGKLSYEYSGNALSTVLCHCLECRALTSSAFTLNVLVPKTEIQIHGNPKHYELTQESGELIITSFCDNCGSWIGKELPNGRFKGLFLIAAGTLDAGLDGVKPDAEIWTTHRAAWLPELAGISQAKEFPE